MLLDGVDLARLQLKSWRAANLAYGPSSRSRAVLWAAASQALSVRQLRAAIGLSRERFEEAYAFLLASPPLGLAVQRHGDELRVVTAPEVTASVERHLNHPKEVALSRAALEVLAIVAYRQPIARSTRCCSAG